jgi:NAD(P)-dependent dehydrogenase (short-subunit alcohol dehydrogenase family)
MSTSKIALVTGGSRGLGRDMALSLAKKGLDVIITYHSNQQAAAEVVSEIEKIGQTAFAFQLDVSEQSSYADFFTKKLNPLLQEKLRVSGFDFLVNNAGTGLHSSFATTSEAQFDELFKIHFKAAFFFSQHALKYMNDGGGIINISSGLTRIIYPGSSAYASMKGALETLTKYQAKELGERKIRVNIVAPGAIETDFNGGMVRDNSEVNQRIASLTALGRVGLPTDIGPVVAFLCTDEASWINAQRIEVSGGQMI